MDRDPHAQICAHRPLALSVARRYARSSQDIEDHRQAAFLGLLEAQQSFDPGRGVSFGAFARRHVQGRVIRELESAKRLDLARACLHQVRDEPETDTPRAEPAMAAAVADFVENLPERERQFTRRVFWEGRSPAEASRSLGFSSARGSAILANVRRKGREALAQYQEIALSA